MNKVFFLTLRRQRIGYKMKIYKLKYHWCQNENYFEKTTNSSRQIKKKQKDNNVKKIIIGIK